MKKQILSLGKTLNKADLKQVKGSFGSSKDCKGLPFCDGLDNYIIINCECIYQHP